MLPTNQYTEAGMNLKQWQRSKKIKAEAEAAAKRTVERVLNAVKEPAMSEFKEFEPKFDEWWEENYMNVSADRTEAFDIYSLGLKHQQEKVEELEKHIVDLEQQMLRDSALATKAQIERSELQTLYTQQGINMLRLQKRVEELESLLEKIHRYGLDAYSVSTCMTIRDELEQALKGEG